MSIAPHTRVLGVSEITYRRIETRVPQAYLINYREEAILHTQKWAKILALCERNEKLQIAKASCGDCKHVMLNGTPSNV